MHRSTQALALLSLVNFMVILDAQIVILALPTIEDALGFSSEGAGWVLSAYLLAFGGLLLLGGRAGDLLGRRRVFLAGAALFGVSSLLCGLAWAPAVLVGARVAQGVSAAIMAPTALAILMTTFAEGPERNRALAVWGGLGGLGATAALLAGGALTDVLGWESIFLINVPVAVALLVLAPRLLDESRAAGTRTLDPGGAVTLTAALVALIYAVVEAPQAGWGSARTLLLVAAAIVLGAAFLTIEKRSRAPLVPLRLFRSPSLVGGNLVMLLTGMAAWAVGLAASQYGQGVLGLSALAFGLGTTILTVMAIAGSYAGQAAVTRAGPRPVAAAGAALLGAGALLLAGVSASGSYLGDLFAGLLVFGLGLGMATVPASIAALAGVPERDAGVASGTNTAAFQLGGALGAAVATTIVASEAGGADRLQALTDGAQATFAACAVFAAAALAAAIALLRPAGGPRRAAGAAPPRTRRLRT